MRSIQVGTLTLTAWLFAQSWAQVTVLGLAVSPSSPK